MQSSREFDWTQARPLYPILGTSITRKDNPELARIKLWHVEEPSHLRYAPWLFRAKENLGLSDIVASTALMYLDRLRLGKNLVGRQFVKEGALFLACRNHRVPIRVEGILAISENVGNSAPTAPRIVRMAYRIAQYLHVEVKRYDYRIDFFRAVETLGLSREFYRDLLATLETLRAQDPRGHLRETDAAALTWVMTKQAGMKRSQKKVAEAFRCCEHSVRMRTLSIRKILEAI